MANSSKHIVGKRQKKFLKSLANQITDLVTIKNQKGKEKENSLRIVRTLQGKELIFLSGEAIILTEKGKRLLGQIEKEEIVLERPENWDGIWRLVAYDIPEECKKERDWFRKKLNELGFNKIQNSMWVYPFECKEELAILAQSLRIAPFVIFLTTDYLPNQTKWLRKFKL